MTALRKNDIRILTDVEHVLKRPNIYCGSPKEEEVDTHIYNSEGGIEFKTILLVPALNKIISEIIDNSRDEGIRCNFQYGNKIEVFYDKGMISVKDNGRGLPIEYNEEYKKWTPEQIFCQLRSGSNFSDDERVTSGQNGVGSALTAIFSKRFIVDTCNGSKRYQQVYENHLARINKPKISDVEKNVHYTEVTFEPNYDYFNISDEAKEYLPSLIKKMIIELCFCYPEINFYFQGKKVNGKSLKQFMSSIHDVYEMNETDKTRIGIFYSDTEFKHISFVNGLSTTRGGTHIDYVVNVIVDYLREFIKKKYKLEVKPVDIKQRLFIFLSMRMVNSQFDNQSKEKCSNSISEFKSLLDEVLTEKFLKSITKNEEIMFPIIEAYRIKQQVKENQELKKITTTKKLKIEKYLPASEEKKFLVLGEGDSAVSLVSSVLGRKQFSYFSLKGKPLNSLDITKSKTMENEELKNIVQILNLNLNSHDQSQCNYQNVVIAVDSDLDGKSICSLLLCFFYKFGKQLLENNRVMLLLTPIIVAKQKGKVKHSFLSLEEYNEFRETHNSNYEYQYVKGLGSNNCADLKELFSKGLDKFLIPFVLDDTTEDSIKNWMSKSTVDYRKNVLRGKEFDINSL